MLRDWAQSEKVEGRDEKLQWRHEARSDNWQGVKLGSEHDSLGSRQALPSLKRDGNAMLTSSLFARQLWVVHVVP